MIIPIENRLSYDLIPRNKDLNLKIHNHCDAPNRVVVVDWKGDCFVCSCEAWLPISVGKIDQFQRLEHVWQSDSAQQLQADIYNGQFTHCAVDRCGVRDSDIRYDQYLVSINIDESCNLACPSCRKQPIMLSSGPEFDHKVAQVNHMVHLLERFEHPCRVIMSGNGDPLASAIMRPLIHRWRPRHDHSIRMFTNGLLLDKQLTDSPILPHVQEYFISIDAGSAEVYERVRLGGTWLRLINNLDWLYDQRERTQAQVVLMMVVQQANYTDIPNFCELVTRYGFKGSVTYLENWGTWQDFAAHDVVGNTSHAEHTQALDTVKSACDKYHGRNISFASKLRTLVRG